MFKCAQGSVVRLSIVFLSTITIGLVHAAVPETIQTNAKIGPRDVLQINVYDEQNLSVTVVVSASGEFSFPLLKRVSAAGKTADELGLHMEKRLFEEKFLRNPSVIVIIVQQNSAVISISGAIKEPGVVPWTPGIKLRDAVITRGGFLTRDLTTRSYSGAMGNPAGPYVYIHRGSKEVLKVDREEPDPIDSGKSADINSEQTYTLDIPLLPGDEVVVPEAKYFYILGSVNTPGGYPLTRKVTLGEAIGLAGGKRKDSGNTLLWHRHVEDASTQLMALSYRQYQEDIAIRSMEIQADDSLYISQNDNIFVGGKVEKPGNYPWEPDMTVAAAVMTAGGKSYVAGNDVYLYRENPSGNLEKFTYKFTDFKNKKKIFKVLPGDIIEVSAGLLNIPETFRKVNPFNLSIYTKQF